MPRPLDPAIKAKAVAEVIAGRPVREVARELGVDPGALSRWRQSVVADPLPTGATTLATSYARSRVAMIEQVFDTVYESLDGVRAIARLTADSDWLRRQDAGGLAQLVGQLYDRSTRMLHGLQPAVEEAAPAEEVVA